MQLTNNTTMNKETITMQEVANDGQSIFLYYDPMAGVYAAYGLSAYYVDMATDTIISYSEAIGKPVVLLGRRQVLYLRQSLTKVEHTQKKYYKFRLRQKIGEAGYQRWAAKFVRDE